MKRRYVLQAGATILGAIALSRKINRSPNAPVLATSTASSTLEQGNTPHHSFPIAKTKQEWREILTPEQFKVLREHETEWAGSSPLNREYRTGQYHCAGCEAPLFSSDTKYDSHTGWPSFYAPLQDAVRTRKDFKFNMERTEVHCARCGGHLGHVFLDGPPPTGKRYCINGVALTFIEA